MHQRSIDKDLLTATIVGNAGGPVITEPWLCDVRAANADLINLHNAERLAQGMYVEPKFKELASEPTHLRDLLAKDFDFIASGEPALRKPTSRYLFVEVEKPRPQAEYAPFPSDGAVYHIIYFRSPLLHLVHSTFSKIMMMLQHTRDEGCLDQHRDLLMHESYSDRNLFIGFLNDIEVLYDHRKLFTPVSPKHLTIPYDYCEVVEGARRFLLAHELAHSIIVPDELSDFFTHEFTMGKVDEQMARAWAIELCCDRIAVGVILDAYQKLYDSGNWPDSLGYELANSLNGMLLVLALLEMVQIATRKQRVLSKSHPPPDLRMRIVRGVIKGHPLYTALPNLARQLQESWWHLQEFRNLKLFTHIATHYAEMAILMDEGKLTPSALPPTKRSIGRHRSNVMISATGRRTRLETARISSPNAADGCGNPS